MMDDDFAAQNKIIEAYKALMREAILRAEFINSIIQNKSGIDPRLAYEVGFLQLRMLCEIIAIGCLTAHGDLPATHTQKLMETWRPHQILAALETIRPHFYPVPFHSQTKDANGTLIYHHRTEGGLTKPELIHLHGVTGGILHKGGAASRRSKRGQPQYKSELPTFALDRVSRYEHLLWRQARQIVFTLESLRRRRHPPNHSSLPFSFRRISSDEST